MHENKCFIASTNDLLSYFTAVFEACVFYLHHLERERLSVGLVMGVVCLGLMPVELLNGAKWAKLWSHKQERGEVVGEFPL